MGLKYSLTPTAEFTLRLPDLSSLTPFSWAGPNPYYSFSDRTSTEWILSYGILSDFKRARLDMTHIELLGAYAYPYADAEGLRIANDMLTILTMLDEYTDDQTEEEVKFTKDTFAKALIGNSNEDITPVSLFTKDFMDRLSHVPEELRDRLSRSFVKYLDATANEATLRTDNTVPTFEEYINIRRFNGGIFVCFDTIEIALGTVLPQYVHDDDNFKSTVLAANDLMYLSNDICSYAAEYSRGLDGMNVVTVLMNCEGLSRQEAVNRAAEIYQKRANDMIGYIAAIRSFGPEVDENVQAFIYGLEQWVYGNNVWNLDTQRFFGEEREEVKRTGIVKLKQRNSAP